MKRSLLMAAFTSLILIRAGLAQETTPLCRSVASIQLPKQRIAGAACDKVDTLELKNYPGHPVNLERVRQCAFSQRTPSSDEDNWQEPVVGNASLAMLYAGGKGVAPNLKLAEQFACNIRDWDGTGADIAAFLESKRVKGSTRVNFDACTMVTGRGLNFRCLVRDETSVVYETADLGQRLNVGQTANVRTAWAALLKARAAYRDKHGYEQPSGTTGNTQGAMREDIDADRAWLAALSLLADGRMPATPNAAKADTALNVAYQKVLRDVVVDDGQQLSLSSKMMRSSERAWLTYREAWVAYASLRWPAVPANAWRAGVTATRTGELEAIVNQR